MFPDEKGLPDTPSSIKGQKLGFLALQEPIQDCSFRLASNESQKCFRIRDLAAYKFWRNEPDP
ncbi:MAG: hypothetical protein CMO80_06660 [Verrucomicrobiales bacterium]|nr:hypothetical protein [Verrucomicrobiales bacterium]